MGNRQRLRAGAVAVVLLVSATPVLIHESAVAGGVPVSRVSSHGTGHHPRGGQLTGGFWGGYFWIGPSYYSTIGPGGQPVIFGPAPWTFFPPFFQVPVPNGGLVGGPMPPAAPAVAPAVRNARQPDSAHSEKMTTLGDRLFRAGNFKKAEERYEQALRLSPGEAAPRVRLAQLALVRGRYDEAAERLRDATSVQPGWLANAKDIRTIYGEPSEFQRPIARLESHLLVQPTDRDGWLVLGAELYLSGQTRRAADVFLRLTDRNPDPTLAAFLDATEVRPEGRD